MRLWKVAVGVALLAAAITAVYKVKKLSEPDEITAAIAAAK